MPVAPMAENRNPPTTAPTIPSTMSSRKPCPVRLTILLPIKPAISPNNIQPRTDIRASSWFVRSRLADQPRNLLLGRQATLRRELIDRIGKRLRQNLQDLILGECGALGKGLDDVRSECTRNLARRNRLIGARIDPGIDRFA